MKRRPATLEEVLARLTDTGEIAEFLNEILTPAERRDVELRWRLMQMLAGGAPQRDIAAELGVSLCKITRGARVLKRPGAVSRRLLEKEGAES